MPGTVQSPEIEAAWTPVWRELLAGIDWGKLIVSPVYLGLGVPHGRREGVIVVPGHNANDLYMSELLWWLVRIGYRAQPSGILWNDRCPDLITNGLVQKILKLHEQTGRPVCLIGHSMGGLEAAAAASRATRKKTGSVATVIGMGTPQRRRIRISPLMHLSVVATQTRIRWWGGRTGCYGAGCACDFRDDASDEIPGVRRVSIFTKDDGVVVGSDCIKEGGNSQDNISVDALSHLGLAFNPEAYKAIAGILNESFSKMPTATA